MTRTLFVRWILRIAVAALTLLLGGAVALFTVALHGYGWGLLLGLVTTAAALVALPGGWARLPFAVGWSALVVEASRPRPEGDVVLAQDAPGWIVLGSAVVVLIAGMVGARRHPAAPPPAAPPEGRSPASR